MSIRLHPLGAMLCLTLLSGCASYSLSWPSMSSSDPPPAAAPAAPLPASIPAQDLVGRWGLAAYHKEEDRARTEAAARAQCRQPYNITRGPSGGVIMHLADQSQPTELSLKGGPDGKNYIGPGEDPAGGARDREIVSFDGNVLITRFTDQEVSGRYGTSVYTRCASAPPPRKSAKKAAAAAKK
jgi:hypothetical protein